MFSSVGKEEKPSSESIPAAVVTDKAPEDEEVVDEDEDKEDEDSEEESSSSSEEDEDDEVESDSESESESEDERTPAEKAKHKVILRIQVGTFLNCRKIIWKMSGILHGGVSLLVRFAVALL